MITKLLNEDNGNFENDDAINNLDDDEIQLLEDILEKAEMYIELGGPILLIIVPMVMLWLRRLLWERTRV